MMEMLIGKVNSGWFWHPPLLQKRLLASRAQQEQRTLTHEGLGPWGTCSTSLYPWIAPGPPGRASVFSPHLAETWVFLFSPFDASTQLPTARPLPAPCFSRPKPGGTEVALQPRGEPGSHGGMLLLLQARNATQKAGTV